MPDSWTDLFADDEPSSSDPIPIEDREAAPTPPRPSTPGPEAARLTRSASLLAKIDLLIKTYSTVEFTEEEKSPDFISASWWTNNYRGRPYYNDIASLISPNSTLRTLALSLISSPSSSSGAERVRTHFFLKGRGQ